MYKANTKIIILIANRETLATNLKNISASCTGFFVFSALGIPDDENKGNYQNHQ